MTSDTCQIKNDLIVEHKDHALVERIVCVCEEGNELGGRPW
jgi:hypothetical protein